MPVNRRGVDDAAAERVIAKALEDFYNALLERIDKLTVEEIFSRKNPYLYRAKALRSASEIIESVLSATVSSSEETIFGNCFFEPLAIFASGGVKSISNGVDIRADDPETNTIYAIAVKSGTSVFNNASKHRQMQNFTLAGRLAQQAKARYMPMIGYCYGRKRPSGRGKPVFYMELAGQDFWEELTGDPEFYLRIIRLMGTRPEQYVERYQESYSRASNRLVRRFTVLFCDEDGNIDWEKLVRFNSGYD